MKTKELIRQLQENDPTGEEECCVGNADIHFVESLPAYYDGCLQVLKRDEANEYYNIIGAKYTCRGRKVKIHTLSISDALFNDKDLPVEFDCSEASKERYEKLVADRRLEIAQVEKDVDRGFFLQYMEKRFITLGDDFRLEEIQAAAGKFYDENLTPDDPMPDEFRKMSESWHTRRCLQWDREIVVTFQDGQTSFTKV